jgi:hypothetical protein
MKSNESVTPPVSPVDVTVTVLKNFSKNGSTIFVGHQNNKEKYVVCLNYLYSGFLFVPHPYVALK